MLELEIMPYLLVLHHKWNVKVAQKIVDYIDSIISVSKALMTESIEI